MGDNLLLWYCPKCDVYFNTTTARVIVEAPIEIEQGDPPSIVFGDDSQDILEDRGLQLASDSGVACPECDGTDIEMRPVPRASCPHRWRLWYGGDRKCAFCGLRQHGHIIYE